MKFLNTQASQETEKSPLLFPNKVSVQHWPAQSSGTFETTAAPQNQSSHADPDQPWGPTAAATAVATVVTESPNEGLGL